MRRLSSSARSRRQHHGRHRRLGRQRDGAGRPVFHRARIWWQGYEQLGIYAAALVGGILGFLIYNFHPAKVFMGDTGSLFLGGTVAALAFAYDMPLVLIPVGFVYICETLSDILQVIYFKARTASAFQDGTAAPPLRALRLERSKARCRVHQRECAVLSGGAVRSTQQISF